VTSRARWASTHLQYRFKNPTLLTQALTHRSASKNNNERLEFLGDALLNLAIAHRLFVSRAEASEGDLSRLRAALVKQSTLAAIAHELGIDSQVILGTGELRAGGARRSSILANTVEALLGAVLLDGGYEEADDLVGRFFRERLEELPEAAALKDPKTQLQEWLQGRGWALPSYAVSSVRGKAHQQTFTVACELRDREAQTTGQGSSRRHAEQQAAAAMLSLLADEYG
jgi:ribonuclease-3